MNEWVVTAASAGVVAFMVGVAALLGFRTRAKLDDAAIARLAAEEGDRVDAAVVAANGASAFARLASGRYLIARAMGGDISTRLAAASALRLRLDGAKLSVAFADIGYPPLHVQLAEAPPWLAALARGEAP